MSSYLVMKTNGTAEHGSRIRRMIQERFAGLEFVEEKDVVNIRFRQGIDVYEAHEDPEHEKHIKEKIAFDLGKILLENNLISFRTKDEFHTKTIEGKVILIRGD